MRCVMNFNIDKWIDIIKKRRDNILDFLSENGYKKEDFVKSKVTEPVFNLRKTTLSELRVACIMDRFTLDSYAPECKLCELTPDGWKNEIDSFMPDLVFIESAWEGKDKLWYRKISNCSKEYYEMTKYCQEKNIPVVFWNKEDPVYTDTFMAAARMADFVFTTDIDCIQLYKTQLGHNNVYHLHFAAQPKIHNPIEKYNRKDKFCFAGAYYHRYQQRAKIFDSFAEEFIKTKGFDIYDRNYKSALPEHAFPKRYNPYILGRLDPSEIDKAYKGYTYGVNMNSIHQSQTMFARRVFEMLASNTITVGNYSRGVKNYFGDLTICTDDKITLRKQLEMYTFDKITQRKYRLAGLRKVLSEHLYEDRLAYVVKKVFNVDLQPALPLITVVSYVENEQSLDKICTFFEAQAYSNKKLILVTELDINTNDDKYIVFKKDEAQDKNISDVIKDGFISVWNTNDEYGKNYLLDLALANRYGNFDAIGKATYYTMKNGDTLLSNVDNTYRFVNQLDTRRAIFKPELLSQESILSISTGHTLTEGILFSIDEFNYCENCVIHCEEAEDIVIADQGLPMDKIEEIAEKIPAPSTGFSVYNISAQDIFSSIKDSKEATLNIDLINNQIRIVSKLPAEQHHYLLFEKLYEISEHTENGKLPITFHGSSDVETICACIFYDKFKNKLSPTFSQLNQSKYLDIPSNAYYFKLGVRVKGEGECRINRITIGDSGCEKLGGCFLSRSNILVLTNHYPSPDALYRNMFVHKRMIAYKESGQVYDVMRMNIYAKDCFREFDGINVVEGQADTLDAILKNGEIDTICVHFLDPHMWGVLKNYLQTKRIIVWIHGSEIQPWWRRVYNYNNQKELEQAKKESAARQEFWKEVFSNIENSGLHFVFVSQYFAEEVFKDNGISLPKDKYSIIHNCIDTKMFSYKVKDPEQRKKILSIRPYANNKYANDLTVKCIQELAKKEFFYQLQFRLIGNGELFDSTLAPLNKYKNVQIEKRFLRQEEIAQLHKEYGVFLTPTRMDAQGVSRDEAMASGLVPITNAVAAIPEFVDEKCGILAPAEDFMAMAQGLERLYNNPELFLELSENAAKRVRNQSAKEFTIDKEVKIIKGR